MENIETKVIRHENNLLEFVRGDEHVFAYETDDYALIVTPNLRTNEDECGETYPCILNHWVKLVEDVPDLYRRCYTLLTQDKLLCNIARVEVRKSTYDICKHNTLIYPILRKIREIYLDDISLTVAKKYIAWVYEVVDGLRGVPEDEWFAALISAHSHALSEALGVKMTYKQENAIIDIWTTAREKDFKIFAYCCGAPILAPDYVDKGHTAADVINEVCDYLRDVIWSEYTTKR